jgi:uncharacterized protein
MSRPPRTAHAPKALDVAAFCRDGGHLEGQAALAELPRFADSVLRSADGAPEAPVHWRADGSLQPVAGGLPQCLVDLAVRAAPILECQRCLQPVAVTLEIERRVRFVHGEEAAARLDEELEDDVLALAPRFDLLALVEDELLLALPLVPRHDVCPELPAGLRPAAEAPAAAAADAAPEPSDGRADHPFAALAALRRPKR